MQSCKVKEKSYVDEHRQQSFRVICVDASEDMREQDRKKKILQLLKKKDLKIEEIKSELEDRTFINAIDMYGNSVLHLVIQKIESRNKEHTAFIQFLLDRGADPSLRSAGGYSPFLLAAMKNKVGAMEVLANCKGNVINDVTDNGDTALHLAIERDHVEAVAFLHELSKSHGFIVDIRSKGSHMTPRELALSKSPRNEKIVKVLDGNLEDVQESGGPHVVLESFYKMSAVPRGKCYIVQNDTFRDSRFNRDGCTDAERLAVTFEKLYFEVTKDLNLTAVQMFDRIRAFSRADHTDYDCFVLCISTHGESDEVLGTGGMYLSLRHIISMFTGQNCKSLIGKPKLFFISACRNDASITSQGLHNDKDADCGEIASSHISPIAFESNVQKPINLEDIFEGYSTPYGFKSYRESDSGNPDRCTSLYIDVLCNTLEEFSSNMEFQQIMLTVNRRVIERKLQVPSPINRLSKQLWFNATT